MIEKVLHDLLTGRDNETHDVARHSWFLSMLGLAGVTVWNALHGIELHLLDFAEATAVIATGHGAALGFKARTEPDPTPTAPAKSLPSFTAEQ